MLARPAVRALAGANGGGGGLDETGAGRPGAIDVDDGRFGSTWRPAATTAAAATAGAPPRAATATSLAALNPVLIPDGYTLAPEGITVFNQATDTSCVDFADCDMWNTHFDAMWNSPANGWSRMGSPFPWPLSRYIVSVPPKRITYAKLHMTAPNEKYVYSDGTPEMYTDPSTHVATCYARGPGHMKLGYLENMGGSKLETPDSSIGTSAFCRATWATRATPRRARARARRRACSSRRTKRPR